MLKGRGLVCGLLSAFTVKAPETVFTTGSKSGTSNTTIITSTSFSLNSMFQSDPYGTVALGLSLASNMTTVVLAALKAWYAIMMCSQKQLKQNIGNITGS